MDRVTPIDASRLLDDYTAALSSKAPATGDAYVRAVRQFLTWLATKPGQSDGFHPDQLTRTAVELYLTSLEHQGTSVAHRARVKAAISSFATVLIEEQGWLRRNPTRGIVIPAQALLAPRELSDDQRYVLHTLVERDGSLRSAALFALGYWAGCRVSDVSWLRLADTHLTRNTGWIRAGHKGGKWRDLDLAPPARQALAAYLAEEHAQALGAGRPFERPYVFISQRHERLTEAGIHHWLRALKAQATKAQSGVWATDNAAHLDEERLICYTRPKEQPESSHGQHATSNGKRTPHRWDAAWSVLAGGSSTGRSPD